jgi:hypothetical protein
LKDSEGNVFAKSVQRFTDKEKSAEEIQAIIQKIIFLNENNLLDARFQITEKDIQSQNGSFYSYQCSLVLPAWPSRFQRTEFRRYLKNLVLLHAPAHLTMNFHWLGIGEMAEFENLYEDWLMAKEVPEPLQPDLDQLSNQLAELLVSYKNREA